MMIVPRNRDAWEIRESHMTAAGPRSRTLATFKILSPEIVRLTLERSSKPLTAEELRAVALRAGAPVQTPTSNRAAAELIGELLANRKPRAVIERLLMEALQAEPNQPTSNAQAAIAWLGATSKRRGETLRDLLLLTDRLPRGGTRRGVRKERFPRIDSAPA